MSEEKRSGEEEPPILMSMEPEADIGYAYGFLARYGYLDSLEMEAVRTEGRSPAIVRRSPGEAVISDALLRFQKFYDLPETGELDEITLVSMRMTRCGVRDFEGNPRLRSCSWEIAGDNILTLNYTFGRETDNEQAGRGFEEVQDAIDTWNRVLDELDIPIKLAKRQVPRDTLHIDFAWVPDGDVDVDLSGRPVAHADLPPRCSVVVQRGTLPLPVHFDEGHQWRRGLLGGTFHIRSVALHEIGHILGLAHTRVSEGPSVMRSAIMASQLLSIEQIDRDKLSRLYAQGFLEEER